MAVAGRSGQAQEAPISLPKGGEAQRYEAGFGKVTAAGAASWSMAVPVTPARNAEPKLTLTYAAGVHNGVFGAGFDIDIPAFALRSDAGAPQYAGADQPLAPDGSQLTPAYQLQSGRWARVERVETLDGGDYLVTRYRPRVEAGFDLVERRENTSNGEAH
ncbi:MAG: hypothetical protein KGM15_03970 [Pseudomonadota bacterium]|nr:hypothetical protein [Pseudomonadota bacterium]